MDETGPTEPLRAETPEAPAPAPVNPVRRFRGNKKKNATMRAERVALMTNRVLWRVIGGLLLLCIIEGGIIISLFPLKETIVVPLDRFRDGFFEVAPRLSRIDAEVALREAFVRRYVRDRETINLVDDADRWKWIGKNTEATAFNKWRRALEENKVWESANVNNNVWKIDLLAVYRPHDKNKDKWTVEFRKTLFVFGESRGAETWVAQIGLKASGGEVTRKQYLENPLNLKVVGYQLTPKSAVEGQQS